jgi:acyl-coenzyme A thioesterase PaaI-like protein
VTDFPSAITYVPSRLGTRLVLDGDRLVGRLEPPPAICTRGAVSMAAVVFLVDVVGGLTVDTDPDSWSFTSEVSVRLPLAPTPSAIDCDAIVLRDGRRSATCEIPLSVDGRPWGACIIGFAKVPRREGDLPKPPFDPHIAASREWAPPLDESLRAAADFISRDAGGGVVAASLRPDLLNPAGAMQGAIVAGLIEAAAEDLADHHLGGGGRLHVVTEMEIRYLAQNRVAPIVSRAMFVGPPAEGLVRVDLVDDDGRGRLTAAAMVRVRPAP